MDCLELNIHQLILSDIAANFAEDDDDLLYAQELITSNVVTRDRLGPPDIDEQEESTETEAEVLEKIFMPMSRIHCHIAFGEMISNFSEDNLTKSIETLLPTLIEVLLDVPFIEFDRCLPWQDWALPDQLAFSAVTALLRVASVLPQCADRAVDSLISFLNRVTDQIESGSALDALTQLAPALHGFYRAISSMPFKWTISQWLAFTHIWKKLCSPNIVDRLNALLVDILRDEEDSDSLPFAQTFLGRYIYRGRPLSGYFIVCCVIETQWTILAQTLTGSASLRHPDAYPGLITEAAAANHAWLALTRSAPVVIVEAHSQEVREALGAATLYSLKCVDDLICQIEAMDSEPEVDTYAWETISEGLKYATVCSIARGELDEGLHAQLLRLLSNESPISDSMVQEAALKSTAVLAQSFNEIAFAMAGHLRRFISSPLAIFQLEFASETRAPPPLAAAAKCLALCIKLAPGDDLMMSNMYSLLNSVAAASKEILESTSVSHMLNNPLYPVDHQHITIDPGLRGLSDDEKRAVGISTISAVTRLAIEFDSEQVTKLTISMLLQRLRSAEPTVEAAIAYNLVDLALVAPEMAFIDIIRAFSTISRSANPEDPRFSNNMVLAAQTRLAQELRKRPEFYEIYLVELLTLFADKGVAIQNVGIANPQLKTDDMIEQLASLLLPIDALMRHEGFTPSVDTATLFRHVWFLCVLFGFTTSESTPGSAMDWQGPALGRISAKTPPMVTESRLALTNEVEYSPVIKQEYVDHLIAKHRATLSKHISLRQSDIRSLSSSHIIFLLVMHDMEMMRSIGGLPSSLVSYFLNDGLNRQASLLACMEAIAEKVIRGCVSELNMQAAEQTLPSTLSTELKTLLVHSTHRVTKAREIASKFLSRLLTSFPSLLCDPPLVFAILEVLTLLRRACDNEFTDEFNPIHEFRSEKTDITLQLSDNYETRRDIMNQLFRNANTWFELAMARAPVELQSTLQKYLAINQQLYANDSFELGASVAENFGKAVGPEQRQLTSLGSLSGWKVDRAKVLTSQMASKGYFAGEAAGLRLATRDNLGNLDKMPPPVAASTDVKALSIKLLQTLEDIRSKNSNSTVQDLKRLLFRCAAILVSLPKIDYELLHYLVILPIEVFTPSAISAGIEIWSWVIAEKPGMEVALLGEVLGAWSDTIRHRRGMFSTSMNYDDPFYRPTQYSPTDKDAIDRGKASAQRLLAPHALVIKMLMSRLQAARYGRPTVMFILQRLVLRSASAYRLMSTHALAREVRFSFVLFGFETLKSSHLDSYCEAVLRNCLYSTAYAWFAVRPQWTYGGSRVQISADIKILSEFMSYIQADATRSPMAISSLSPSQLQSQNNPKHLNSMKHPLRILLEHDLYRLSIWANPTKDAKRGIDPVLSAEQQLTEQSWAEMVKTLWQLNPSIVIHLPERFKNVTVRNEVVKLIRANPLGVLDTPEAIPFLLEDRTEGLKRRDLKHLLLWSPVPPVIANTFFERRFNNNPLILQYAHRVLEQHPVDLTFFYVPQVVQVLRYDDLGYIARFIFETAKISQLFCHQIIWNMKANCYKDDAAEMEDPMKPQLDAMTEAVVSSLSGDARAFYDREFGFFNEVTSISGKLKPFIKKTKPEKKAKIDEEMAKIVVDVGVYLPSNPDGVVIDIDKKSGRPLQSHAKAPFMATFKVRKEKVIMDADPDSLIGTDENDSVHKQYEVWQQAIFKVGDDCRQDMLALQIIAMFKSIFESIGLTLYLMPYRVTATGPGCGIIDVVPNSTSRDEMGRAKVNDLLDFFISKYGSEDSVAFQQARLNFIQSMAAYSVACYILQIKDRHNGNIMIDGEGHIVHVDFGFLFDIDNPLSEYFERIGLMMRLLSLRPGGVKFEPDSFKLNHEMIALMGGRYSQGYQLFQTLTVKAYLAIRPHVDQLVATVHLMLGTGLPSFKGEATIKRLRDRFAPGLDERQAAEWMMGIIKNAHENVRSIAYDEFQRLQNGIPYK